MKNDEPVGMLPLPEALRDSPDVADGARVASVVIGLIGRYQPSPGNTHAPFICGLMSTLVGASISAIGKEGTVVMLESLLSMARESPLPTPPAKGLH